MAIPRNANLRFTRLLEQTVRLGCILLIVSCGVPPGVGKASLGQACTDLVKTLLACPRLEVKGLASDVATCVSFMTAKGPVCTEAFLNLAACIKTKGCANLTEDCQDNYEATSALCGNFLNVQLLPRASRRPSRGR